MFSNYQHIINTVSKENQIITTELDNENKNKIFIKFIYNMKHIVACFPQAVTAETTETSKGSRQ
jgi:DNA-binding sugar fermentation-stimulating protein